MKFNFLQSTTAEVDETKISYDLIAIQDFVNERILLVDFGTSISTFNLGYEIYNFQGRMKPHTETADLRRWSPKYNSLLVVKQFDFNTLKFLSPKEQFRILKEKIIEAIADFDKFDRKPNDFNHNDFRIKMEQILDEYSRVHFR